MGAFHVWFSSSNRARSKELLRQDNATVVTVTVYNILLFINMIISSISKSVLHIMFYLCMWSHISNNKLMYR